MVLFDQKRINVQFLEEPLTDSEVDEIMSALGLKNGEDIPIEKIIDLFTIS